MELVRSFVQEPFYSRQTFHLPINIWFFP